MHKSIWFRVSDRLPEMDESPSGYYWCWDENKPHYEPMLLEAWERDGITQGFCAESCGAIGGITHWTIAVPPNTTGI